LGGISPSGLGCWPVGAGLPKCNMGVRQVIANLGLSREISIAAKFGYFA
jgi:hypothetical protein